jgi:hypothetical protein
MNTAKPDDDIPLEAGLDFPDPVPTIQAESTPLRDDDREPSCSIYAEGTHYKDQDTGESGDSFELFKAVKNWTAKPPGAHISSWPVSLSPTDPRSTCPIITIGPKAPALLIAGSNARSRLNRGLDTPTFAWVAARQRIGYTYVEQGSGALKRRGWTVSVKTEDDRSAITSIQERE